MAKDGAVNADVEQAVAREIGADELARRPFEHLHDLAFGPALVPPLRLAHAHQHHVAGRGAADRFFGDEDLGEIVPFLGIGPDEAEPRLRLAKDAGERAVRPDRTDGVALADLDAPQTQQFLERGLERVILRRG